MIKDVVLKYFLPQKDAFANTEDGVLYKIRSLVPSVPGVIGFATPSVSATAASATASNPQPTVLVLDSVGLPFTGRSASRLTRFLVSLINP